MSLVWAAQDTDVVEIDHITTKVQGGGEELGNKCLLHQHCHDDRHAGHADGISDKDHIIEEPDEEFMSGFEAEQRR